MTTKSKAAAPLDHPRERGPDPEDPRCSPKCWPCFNKHGSFETGSNSHGLWKHCGICGLRTSYVPRVNSLGKNVQKLDMKLVANVMNQLEMDLRPQGKLPNRALFELLLELVETGQKISGLKYQLMHLEEQAMALEHRYQKTLKMDPSASSTKEMLVKKEETELMGYLTEEEKAKILSVVEERKNKEAAQIDDPDAEFVTPQRGTMP